MYADEVSPTGRREFVYLTGRSEKGTVLGLGGSKHHMVGAVKDVDDDLGLHSHLRVLAWALPRLDGMKPGALEMDANRDDVSFGRWIEETETLPGSPAQNVDFLAKRLFQVDLPSQEATSRSPATPERRVVLATPIYVALAD